MPSKNRLLRILCGWGMAGLWIVGVRQSMLWETGLGLPTFGAGCGSGVGWALAGRRWMLVGAALGRLATVAYLPLWCVFNLPPYIGIDL